MDRVLEEAQAQYCTENPDVRDAVRRGETPDAMTHFRDYGYIEGRHGFERVSEIAERLSRHVGERLRPWELGRFLQENASVSPGLTRQSARSRHIQTP